MIDLKNAPLEKRSNKEFVLLAVESDGFELKYASDKLKADKEVVLKAVANWSESLEYASDALKADKEVILKAIENDGFGGVENFAANELREDEDILAALREAYGDEDWSFEKITIAMRKAYANANKRNRICGINN